MYYIAFPNPGASCPKPPHDESLRELLEGNYRIIYELLPDDRILILEVHHASRPLELG